MYWGDLLLDVEDRRFKIVSNSRSPHRSYLRSIGGEPDRVLLAICALVGKSGFVSRSIFKRDLSNQISSYGSRYTSTKLLQMFEGNFEKYSEIFGSLRIRFNPLRSDVYFVVEDPELLLDLRCADEMERRKVKKWGDLIEDLQEME